jgi:hypothetical protein
MAEPADFSGLRFEAPDPDPAPAPQPAAPASGPAAPPEKAPKADEPDERYEALEREVNELRSSNRQLVDLVGRAVPPKKDAAPTADPLDDVDWGEDPKDEDEAEPEDPTALVDDLAKLGRDALAKRGFVRTNEVRRIVREESRKAAVTAAKQIVGKTRAQVTSESAILRDFPDLADPESELYKATVPHIQAAVRLDPGAARNPSTLFLAATAAKAALDAKKGGGKQRGDRDDFEPDDEEEEDREPVRRAAPSRNVRDIRIASQSGDRNRTPSRTERRGDDDFVMDADAKSVAKMMGLTDDEYRAEATRVRKTSSQSRRRA